MIGGTSTSTWRAGWKRYRRSSDGVSDSLKKPERGEREGEGEGGHILVVRGRLGAVWPKRRGARFVNEGVRGSREARSHVGGPGMSVVFFRPAICNTRLPGADGGWMIPQACIHSYSLRRRVRRVDDHTVTPSPYMSYMHTTRHEHDMNMT